MAHLQEKIKSQNLDGQSEPKKEPVKAENCEVPKDPAIIKQEREAKPSVAKTQRFVPPESAKAARAAWPTPSQRPTQTSHPAPIPTPTSHPEPIQKAAGQSKIEGPHGKLIVPRRKVSAQNRRSPSRPTLMPRRRGYEATPSRPPGIELTEADWDKRFLQRCQLVAEMSNRPPLRHLRARFVCPLPPHCGLRVGNRVWRHQFILWRELCFAMAVVAGFNVDGPGHPVPANFEGSQQIQTRPAPQI